MSRFANNALLGVGLGLGLGLENKERTKEIKGTTKPLMAILDISRKQYRIKVQYPCIARRLL